MIGTSSANSTIDCALLALRRRARAMFSTFATVRPLTYEEDCKFSLRMAVQLCRASVTGPSSFPRQESWRRRRRQLVLVVALLRAVPSRKVGLVVRLALRLVHTGLVPLVIAGHVVVFAGLLALEATLAWWWPPAWMRWSWALSPLPPAWLPRSSAGFAAGFGAVALSFCAWFCCWPCWLFWLLEPSSLALAATPLTSSRPPATMRSKSFASRRISPLGEGFPRPVKFNGKADWVFGLPAGCLGLSNISATSR